MREISDEIVKKIISRIYRDTLIRSTDDSFVVHYYKASQFAEIIDEDSLKDIIGFLPNTTYKGKPFILCVAFNKLLDQYEIIVSNQH